MSKICKPTLLAALITLALVSTAGAYGVAAGDQGFLDSASGIHIGPFLYLGAKRMVTGYDHLFYLAGVIFFLARLRDVFTFVSLFAAGHSITLLFGLSVQLAQWVMAFFSILAVALIWHTLSQTNKMNLAAISGAEAAIKANEIMRDQSAGYLVIEKSKFKFSAGSF